MPKASSVSLLPDYLLSPASRSQWSGGDDAEPRAVGESGKEGNWDTSTSNTIHFSGGKTPNFPLCIMFVRR